MMDHSWNILDIHQELKQIIENVFEFSSMTSVQAIAIPHFLSFKDLIVQAVTGSGKTLSFVVPILQILLQKHQENSLGKFEIGAIVVIPTRELAIQIHETFRKFTDHLTIVHFNVMLLVGGSPISKDIDFFKSNGAHIIISTPGRLYDLLEKCGEFASAVRKNLEIFILDEADQLLSLGFEKILNEIIRFLPKLRRTSLYSATQTKQIDQLIRVGLRNPFHIEIKDDRNSNIDKRYIHMPEKLQNYYIEFESHEDKLPFLIEMICESPEKKFIIFVSTCAQVDFLEVILKKLLLIKKRKSKMSILKLHRKLKNKRKKIFEIFLDQNDSILICTDLMSRGVDIPSVDWVINYDLPLSIENYVHRCGRSAHQFDQNGNSVQFCVKNEKKFVQILESKGVLIDNFETRAKIVPEESLKFEIFNEIKMEARRNINFYQLSMQAYVSFIRTYATKQFMSQWLFKNCDIVDIANGYGLLRMPKMPEFRHTKKSSTVFKENVEDRKICKNFDQISFDKKKKTKSTSSQNPCDEADTEKRKSRKNPLGFRRNVLINEKINQKLRQGKLRGKRTRNHFFDQMDLEELNADARMVKKLATKKISNQEFDNYFGLK
ncbi:ATP-dependent RNA helicase DDX55 [Sarcoptes scabiei]|uniref:ATP-dependent RNA helicase n=1 Tax=Sarcoptes scabiei TaxID=52283 RepID=A0A834R836_SARSC|nr:ATP-dependent RNA helicase DDX55 [Sarcoptes scabiei]